MTVRDTDERFHLANVEVGQTPGAEAPFTGTLVHHGWRAEWVKLPRLLRASADRLPTIAPAEVEVR